ncbi:T. brucei spp.-specific protein [Trypanosoma brucei gambiense DAL972]|uniref:T. brucei spp.-specific protein n=1 Tax=Trypanosoma brucei gambiense (strain MHOM/CI/86/DAL972) TaxID=679716 RepID=C9ZWK4_TRYB9|nr:T. brucei spp.-specific protein [Trypanosoma brucei gambiense DAL972]CBH13793.1 T. brucei spp.-specific protein [Trypanosoma brucei gambiense DAL972]|eukprot:XP_011776069.1 T. brucei spp.-specific protein [Trypanosoma brucei gambiense DAL972]
MNGIVPVCSGMSEKINKKRMNATDVHSHSLFKGAHSQCCGFVCALPVPRNSPLFQHLSFSSTLVCLLCVCLVLVLFFFCASTCFCDALRHNRRGRKEDTQAEKQHGGTTRGVCSSCPENLLHFVEVRRHKRKKRRK